MPLLEQKPRKKKRITGAKAVRILLMVIVDIVLINLSGFLSLLLRFELNFKLLKASTFLESFIKMAPSVTLITLAAFLAFKLYTSVWEFAGMKESVHIIAGAAISAVSQPLIMLIFQLHLPRSYVFIYFFLLSFFEGAFRLSYRAFRDLRARLGSKGARTMIIGAGQTGAMVLRELQSNTHAENKIICFVDDDQSLHGKYLGGVRVVGGSWAIKDYVRKYRIKEIILAVPHAKSQERNELLNLCQDTGCRLRIVPAVYQLSNGEVALQEIRNVEVEDLLGRDPVAVNLDEIAGYVSGKTVLVTGGGGSIGSELCRQIAKYSPKKLIIFDIYENNAYDIQQELLKTENCPPLEVLIGSVRDEKRVNDIFETYRPDIVYHAAAHKHVPLMEDSPNEAIKNNVFGTLNVAKAADSYSAETMVLISTDKAVNPTNVMGASKRICEMIVQTLATYSKTRFVAVRFGNVLGSNGSVIPLFRSQIAAGGPVTVTHKDIIRYFMTIPEAVSLVMQAGAYAKGGEVFVLNMGEPVRIYDLAVNMIKLSGFKPFEDIDIQITGLRPGEKLYEEMLMDEEGLDSTPNNLIHIGHPNDFDGVALFRKLGDIRGKCMENDGDIVEAIADIVPTFHPELAGRVEPVSSASAATAAAAGASQS